MKTDVQQYDDVLDGIISSISNLRRAIHAGRDKDGATYLGELKKVEDNIDDILFALTS